MKTNPDAPVSRRNFISGATAATTVSIVSPQYVRGSQANSNITVALIGAGRRGTYDAGIANAPPRAKITALCDLFDDLIEVATAKLKLEKPTLHKDFEK